MQACVCVCVCVCEGGRKGERMSFLCVGVSVGGCVCEGGRERD